MARMRGGEMGAMDSREKRDLWMMDDGAKGRG